jgi:hypothetical protein
MWGHIRGFFSLASPPLLCSIPPAHQIRHLWVRIAPGGEASSLVVIRSTMLLRVEICLFAYLSWILRVWCFREAGVQKGELAFPLLGLLWASRDS